MAAHLARAEGPGYRCGQAACAALDATVWHSGAWPAAFPCHDHRQPARTAHRPQPVESQLHRGRAPNQAWAGDITYIQTEEGWLFLAVVIDLFSRRVVG